MATRSIIEIDVQDDAFKRFYSLFEEYSATLESQPETWRRLGEAMGESTSALEGGATSGKEAIALAAAQATLLADAIRDAGRATGDLETRTTRAGRAVATLRKGAEGVASAFRAIAGGLVHFAEFAGLGTLLGGFGIGSLAGAAFNRYRESGRLGLTPGQLASFQVNAQQFLGTGALEAAANAQIDISKAGSLAVLGIDFRKAQHMDTADLAFTELKAARAAYLTAQKQGISPMQMPAVMQYLELGGDIGDVRMAAQTPLSELESAQARTRRDAAALGFDRDTAKKWANLKIELDKAGVSIETALIKGLAPLTPQLTDLAKAVADLITGALGNKTLKDVLEEAAQGIGHLANFLEGVDWPQVGADVAIFGEDVGKTIKFFADKFGWLYNVIPSVQDVERIPQDYGDAGKSLWKILSAGAGRFGGDFGKELQSMVSGGSGKIADAWKFLNSPIAQPAAAAVLDVAHDKGVDPLLALAMAKQESGLNPRSIGDQGSSFGIYQLHEGGELGNLSPEQAFDPKTNAQVALGVLSDVLKLSPAAALNRFSAAIHSQARYGGANPTHAEIAALAGSPGMYAALAQRPADPFEYAREVNEKYKALSESLPSSGDHQQLHKTIQKALKKRTQKPATVSIYNSTAARVAVSVNAAGLA